MVEVNVGVEGATDLAVVSRVVTEAGLEIGVVYGQRGKAHLDSCLAGFNHSARFRPWVVVRDLDRDTCAAHLVGTLLPGRAKWMRLRIATRTIESWLLADAESLAQFLAVSPGAIPQDPDTLDDPKSALINLARRSRRRAIIDDLVPQAGTRGRVGSGYTARISEFATRHWRPTVAARHTDSLRRCLMRISELASFSSRAKRSPRRNGYS